MKISSIKADSINYLSVSRIKAYKDCSESYRQKYVLKNNIFSSSKATVKGSLVHEALEEFYRGEYETVLQGFRISCVSTLKRLGVDLDGIEEELFDYAEDQASLLRRSCSRYCGPIPIRTQKGEIPSNPSMTSSWKESDQFLNLSKRSLAINTKIVNSNANFLDIDLPSTFGEAYFICSQYKEPEETVKVLHIEFPLSKYIDDEGEIVNPALMPNEWGGNEGMFLHGFIDKVSIVCINGEEGLAITDFKTGSEFLEEDVEYNSQLYAYVYAYELLTQEEVKFIGIHNLAVGNSVFKKVDRDVMDSVLNSLFSTYSLIKSNHFVKQVPDSKYSKCKNMFGKPCPYLSTCWPGVKA